MKIECPWVNCEYNSFGVSDDMKKELLKGFTLEGTGLCNCKETIHLLSEEDANENEFLICDNYIDGCKVINLIK